MKKKIEFIDNNREIVNAVLKEYAKDCRYILEFGSGVSTKILATEVAKRNGHVWTVDVKEHDFNANPNITVITGNSLEIPWERCVDMLYIDGCHRPEHVWRELERFARFVNPGGWILLDDIRNAEVPRLEFVLDKWAKEHGIAWWYGDTEPCGVAVMPVPGRLGAIKNVDIISSTDCKFCQSQNTPNS